MPTIETTDALATQPKTPVPMHVGARGIELRSYEEFWRFACAIVKSGFAPKDMNTPEALFIALQLGAELGLPPMAAVQNIAVINGRPTLWGDAMLAVCRMSGVFDEAAFEESWGKDEEGSFAICTVRRLPNGKPITRRYSAKDVQVAGLGGKGPHAQYPKRMQQMRARSWALRDAFADVLRGIRPAEEVMEDPIDVEAVPPAQQTRAIADATPALDKLTAAMRGARMETVTGPWPAVADQPEQVWTPSPGAPVGQPTPSSTSDGSTGVPSMLAEAPVNEPAQQFAAAGRPGGFGDNLTRVRGEIIAAEKIRDVAGIVSDAELGHLGTFAADELDLLRAWGERRKEQLRPAGKRQPSEQQQPLL